MQVKKDIYLGQESLDSVNKDIETYLKNGSSVEVIANSLLGTDKAILIITKWCGGHIIEFTKAEQLDIFIHYINEHFKHHIDRSCVSDEVKELLKKNVVGKDIDDYADFLTELINSDGYRRVGHNLTNILACFKPYMDEKYPNKYDELSKNEKEVALVKFIKEHLSTCRDKK